MRSKSFIGLTSIIVTGERVPSFVEIPVLQCMLKTHRILPTIISGCIRSDSRELQIRNEDVEKVIRQTVSYMTVPSWFHVSISVYQPLLMLNPSDPNINTIVLAKRPEGETQFSDPVDLASRIKVWVTYCINRSRSFGASYCGPFDENRWSLSEPSFFDFVNGRTLELMNEKRTVEDWISAAIYILSMNLSTEPPKLSREIDIPVALAQYIKNSILDIYIQPEWFLLVLLTNLHTTPDDPALLTLIVQTNDRAVHKIKGDLFKAVDAWMKFGTGPSRYHVPMEGYAAMTVEAIQQHLNSLRDRSTP
jgi:hypothetical protein